MTDSSQVGGASRATAAEGGPLPCPPYLAGLNEAQRQAVEALEGPLLVLAGAGTGKTRVLTTRLAHILNRGLAAPWQVLAVTFTNKAAREMRERVARLVEASVDGWWVGTFHALGARILRSHAEAVGLKPNFTILDADDQVRLVKRLLEEQGVGEKALSSRYAAAVVGRWKDRGLTPDQVTEAEGAGLAGGRPLRLYRALQERLQALNAVDFGDLLLLCLTLFRERPEVAQLYQRRFRYLLVDEYQDSNVAQYLWLRLLAKEHRNICCVGDDDQSIYSWRGAEIGNILRFEKDFPGARVIRLERNYRSTPHILGAASGLIGHNAGRLGKTLWTDGPAGDKVQVTGLWDGEAEARAVVHDIEALRRDGDPLAGMAILVRAGFQTREFEERLMNAAIPYQVIGGQRFYERQEIRDAVAYFRVVVQPDDDLAFERILNVPKRGLGPGTLQALHRRARERDASLTQAARLLVEGDELKPQARNALAALFGSFQRWRDLLPAVPHVQLAVQVLEESGYVGMWLDKAEGGQSPDAAGRVDNLKELAAAMHEFENLQGFLEHVSLVTENDESVDGDRVSLMTLHGAKGLEFDTVFLPGWEEGLFPHQRAVGERGGEGLEEERRLAYVGVTRARKRVRVSYAANRRVYDRWQFAAPSPFIGELPDAHVERRTAPGIFLGGRGTPSAGGFREEAARWRGRPAAARPRLAVIDGRAGGARGRRAAQSASAAAAAFAPGQRVFHQKFGYGRVTAVDGDKLEIQFEKAGAKKVKDGYVEAV